MRRADELIATVTPRFADMGTVTAWVVAGPDGTVWGEPDRWADACRLVVARHAPIAGGRRA